VKILSAIVTLAAIQSLSAGVVTFVADPTANSVDFANAVALNSGTITTLTFDDQATGALNPDAYSGLGVTLTGVNFTTIVNGAGPGQGNTTTGPTSPGEGAHPVSNFLSENSSTDGSLTVSFASPVLAAGLFTIDLFNPGGTFDPVSLSAFTGPNGTGTLLGTAAGVGDNFQNNNLYFLGILSTAGDIGSVVFTHDGDSSGDVIGLDNVEFAGGTTSTPEPGTLSLIGIGLVGAALARKRLRS
jgi:hypothetical protein